jgi:hypothetical protein
MKFDEYAVFDRIERPRSVTTEEMNQFMAVYETSLAEGPRTA